MLTTLTAEKTAREFWTAEEFLDWLEPGKFADLINGEIFMHSPANFAHSDILNFLHGLLYLYVEQKEIGRVHRENVAVRFSKRDVFMPDVCFFTPQQVAQFEHAFSPVAPTFVIEALSPSSIDRDTGDKLIAYERYGVSEYWIVDPDGEDHQFFRRTGDMFEEFAQGETRIESASIPGFWIERSWLSLDAIPKVTDCLARLCS